MISTRTHRQSTAQNLLTLLLAGVALCIALASTQRASAALIVDAISYDGHVRNGTTTGVEEHSTTTNFPPPIAGNLLPATNPPLTPPLLPSKNLTMTATTASELFNSVLYDAAIIQISAPSGNVFANALDNTLTFPVQLEIDVFSDIPGTKIVLDPANIGIENFNLPPFSSPMPGSYTVSGLGTPGNPLHITLGLTAAQIDDQNGFVKLHLRHSTMVVPEPACLTLVILGCVGLSGFHRFRRPA